MTTRTAFFVYGVLCHAMFLGVYLWMAAFVGGFAPAPLPSLDGVAEHPLWFAALANLGLVALFTVPHSVMARPRFKRWWTQYVPPVIERSTYILVSNILMIVLLALWQPMGGVVWSVTDPAGRAILWSLFAFGWLLVPATSLMTNHFDLFGTRQVWLHLRGRPYTPLPFEKRGLYKVMRHPLYVGWLFAFWATPTMTVTHLVFAAGMTAYILAAIPFEERDLIAHYGEKYREYRRTVGRLIPRPAVVRAALRGVGILSLALAAMAGLAWVFMVAVTAVTVF